MADEAEEMLEILFKQIRKLVRDLDKVRKQIQQYKQAQMPRSLMEEARDIQQQHPGVDRVTSQREPADRYAQIEREVQVLRQREADLQRQLDDRQRELEANQDLNRDGIDDTSVDDRDERDEVTDDRDDREENTDDRDERDEQEQQDEREREEQEQREREEEERRREQEEERKREEEARKRQEEEKRETGTPNPTLPVAGAAAGAGAAAALDDDFDQTAEQMQADNEAARDQLRESMDAQREQIAEQQREQLNQGLETPEQEQTETRQEQAQQERVQQEQPDQTQARQEPLEQTQAQQEQLDQTQDPQEQVREQEEREPQAQEDREQQAEVEQDGVDGDGPESRREQETERQEEDREQADVGTGEGFATGGDHAVADRAAEQAEQPDGRVQAEDQLLEQERLDRQNQGGASPEQDGTGRSQMSPEEMQRLQDMNKGLENPNGAVGSRPSGESLDGARGGQTAAQLHAKTTQRGGREQSGHELQKG
ncbi:hypothetical protein ACFTSF_05440 [Kribbella sp. NPDC056951]|uniref:hypothetical protein n=1 Tax=Kribbella sp. NPDC056951 TaxID=3345978 RepID=UPI003630B16E